ncbi:MAG: hypothetical protein M3P50_04825 [Actinomycetota bacterium]|nr:hypothetical protein [Actinomycetota bacterium]
MLAAQLLLAVAFAADPHAPVLVHDRDERSPVARVEEAGRRIPGVAPGPGGTGRAVAYRHVAPARDGGTWRQYWLFFADNPQDRGIVRTGRLRGLRPLTAGLRAGTSP